MSRTMVALDFSKKEDVMNFLDKFDKPIYVKVGMELTYAFGFEMIREIKAKWQTSFVYRSHTVNQHFTGSYE